MSGNPADKSVMHSTANITLLIKARKKMIEDGFIEPLKNNYSLKNVYHRSDPAPYIVFIEQKINTRYTTVPAEHRISNIELNYIEFLIDSDYFRRTFFNNRVFTEYGAFGRSMIEIDSEKSPVKSAFQYISNILGHIAIPSYYLVDVFGKDYVKKIDMEDILKNHASFDDFYPYFLNKQKIKTIRTNEAVKDAFNYLGDVEQERYYFDNVIYKGIFFTIPFDLANKILFLEQGLHTTINAFSKGYQEVYL